MPLSHPFHHPPTLLPTHLLLQGARPYTTPRCSLPAPWPSRFWTSWLPAAVRGLSCHWVSHGGCSSPRSTSDPSTLHPPPAFSLPAAARVQLHCCRSGSGGGTADYDTIAAADIPLRSLLVPGGGVCCNPKTLHGGCCTAWAAPLLFVSGTCQQDQHLALAALVPLAGGVQEYQQCTLRRPDGHTCGTLRYALAALKTMCCHPAASLLPAAAPPHSRSMAAGAASAGKPRRLVVKVLGCRDLRPAHGSMSPYVALLLPAAAGVEAGRQLVFETRRAASGGASPVFQEAAAFSVSGSAAAQGLTLDAVVFNDAAGGAAGDYAIIGAAHIAVQAAGGAGGGSGSGSGATLYPLLHPGSGRHAGALELAVGWE